MAVGMTGATGVPATAWIGSESSHWARPTSQPATMATSRDRLDQRERDPGHHDGDGKRSSGGPPPPTDADQDRLPGGDDDQREDDEARDIGQLPGQEARPRGLEHVVVEEQQDQGQQAEGMEQAVRGHGTGA